MKSTEITGKCIIFSAPSGAGKTTLVHKLLESSDQYAFSVSACSREPRENEVDGVDYYFIGTENFKQKIAENAFVEWEEVYLNRPGNRLIRVSQEVYLNRPRNRFVRVWEEVY